PAVRRRRRRRRVARRRTCASGWSCCRPWRSPRVPSSEEVDEDLLAYRALLTRREVLELPAIGFTLARAPQCRVAGAGTVRVLEALPRVPTLVGMLDPAVCTKTVCQRGCFAYGFVVERHKEQGRRSVRALTR